FCSLIALCDAGYTTTTTIAPSSTTTTTTNAPSSTTTTTTNAPSTTTTKKASSSATTTITSFLSLTTTTTTHTPSSTTTTTTNAPSTTTTTLTPIQSSAQSTTTTTTIVNQTMTTPTITDHTSSTTTTTTHPQTTSTPSLQTSIQTTTTTTTNQSTSTIAATTLVVIPSPSLPTYTCPSQPAAPIPTSLADFNGKRTSLYDALPSCGKQCAVDASSVCTGRVGFKSCFSLSCDATNGQLANSVFCSLTDVCDKGYASSEMPATAISMTSASASQIQSLLGIIPGNFLPIDFSVSSVLYAEFDAPTPGQMVAVNGGSFAASPPGSNENKLTLIVEFGPLRFTSSPLIATASGSHLLVEAAGTRLFVTVTFSKSITSVWHGFSLSADGARLEVSVHTGSTLLVSASGNVMATGRKRAGNSNLYQIVTPLFGNDDFTIIEQSLGVPVNRANCTTSLSNTIIQCNSAGRITLLIMNDNQQTQGKPLPLNISDMSELVTLVIHKSGFTGSIPTSYGLLRNLTVLDLSQNDLSGEVPAELARLTVNTLEIKRVAANYNNAINYVLVNMIY
ncbi:UNVERIFIED_CONTAM: hypothetical protein HDU68_005223, partial [Siphonaria sp. JEL0065]